MNNTLPRPVAQATGIVRRLLLICAVTVASLAMNAGAAELSGAGSTFVEPLLGRWINTWSQQSGTRVSYKASGSGAGIEQVKAGTVDFAMTDAPLSEDELTKNNLTQFPVVAGGIAIVVNFPGERRRLQLTGTLLAEIYLGRITQWNDPKLQELNPAMPLPAQPIIVLYRGDSSGTSFNITSYLTKVSPEWAQGVGTSKAPQWPTGRGIQGNETSGDTVIGTPYSIAYVEYGYALDHNMQIVGLRDAAGKTVSPTQSTISSAVDAADWANAPHFSVLLVGVQGNNAWPIAAVTWAVVSRTPRRMADGQGTLDFFRWVIRNGAALADAQGYTPMPERVVKLIEAAWAREMGR
ncbi:phosphate ABC transporter substrate-binding protein PstS [Tahibacter amnicola]|uniref:Phosphate-binding protein PstS n=1 Tax=Tahibacter amnicola TaxID=2976241 RepID=A0ABY6BFK1_9GAMM|nr:phosphate ABC transporter substrate-binding protein PstS [Tahibacter amnicola]UXI68038.1 phosphate ABC transporter substrate-binding protein PstS [Tahibacter amnicola]